MLGVVTNPTVTPSDEVVRAVAERMGVADTFRLTPVGVFFGDGPGRGAADPFFGGAGPERTGCLECGCVHDGMPVRRQEHPAQELLVAGRGGRCRGAAAHDGHRGAAAGEGWAVDTVRTGAWRHGVRLATITAGQVVVAAGTYGTQRLLHRMRDTGVLPHLSPRLGELTRTNSESLLGATTRRRRADYSTGVAITSSFHPEPATHVEPVRYGAGSNLMGLLSTVLTDGGGRWPRVVTWAGLQARHPVRGLRALWVRRWSQRTVIALVMQSVDNSLVVSGRRGVLGRWRLTSRHGHGEPNPTWIPAGNEAVRQMADVIGGEPGGSWLDLSARR